MKRIIVAAAAALALAAQARVMPISEGRLYTDLDAAGHSITNLPAGFFPTNGFLRAETDQSLGAFAATGTVWRAGGYGTPTRWTDATGCVWEVVSGWLVYTNSVVAHGWLAYQYATDSGPFGNTYGLRIRPAEGTDDEGYAVAAHTFPDGVQPSWSNEYETAFNSDVEFYGLSYGDEIRILRGATNLVGRVALTNDLPDVSGYATQQQATNAATAVADTKISTNNAAFVSAVLAVPLTGADAGDLAEIAEYGGYGTVGAALLALIAGLAALKRRMGTAETALAGKMPMYPMVAVTPPSGTLTVTPYTVATYTADTSAAAFTVAVGTGTAGKARDCELVIDCTGSGAVAPTVTWPSNFHPRTDAATDFACETGVRNVYFISEYAAGEFAVGGWQETAGGNGT